MAKRYLSLAILVLILCALFVGTAVSKAVYDRRDRVQDDRLTKITRYALPSVRDNLVARGVPEDFSAWPADPSRRDARASLGAAQPGAVQSAGMVVDNTYMDDQYRPPAGHMVSFGGPTPSIHFTYSDATSPSANSRFGYNIYDPVAADWPRGSGVGCEVQPTDQTGQWVMNDIDPRGLLVFGGEDDAGGSADNHFYFQPSQHSCFFGAGSVIPAVQYNDGHFLDVTNHLTFCKIEVQEYNNDTIMHVLAGESSTVAHPTARNLLEGAISYYRKLGTGDAGTWEGPTVMDTTAFYVNGSIAASRVSGDVAVSYTHYHDMAYANNQVYDVEVFFRLSDNGGASWGLPTNLTSYPRTGTQASHAAWVETSALYDSEGGLHIVFNAEPIVADPYNDPIFFWGDFSSSMFHWTDRVPGPKAEGTITRVHNAEWGINYNTQVCGFGSPGTMYLGYFSISECNSHLYTVFTQYLDAWGNFGLPQTDDCASGFADRTRAANGEIAICVSTTLDGILWDAARDLTNSYTPGCDSAGYGGTCMNDTRPTLSRYGMDSSAYGVELKWPGADFVDPSGEYTGHHYLHAFYTEDHYPAPGWRDPEANNMLTLNPLKWMRLACVDPVDAPQIVVAPDELGYPSYCKHGQADTIPVTVTNDGNVPLSVDSIKVFEDDTGPSDWLDVSAASLAVGAGVYNTGTFDIIINKDGTIDSPGTIVALDGEVCLFSDADNRDSLPIMIAYIVADTVIGMAWDTLATSGLLRPVHEDDFVRLVVSNNAEMGANGGTNGLVNLDFVTDGGECNSSASVYLYSGGPLVMQRDIVDIDTSYVLNYAMHQASFATYLAFKRVDGFAASGPVSGTNFDGYFTGTVVNADTTIAVEREYFAPTGGGDSTDFIIMRTRFSSLDGNPHSNLVIGEAIDWDIPADNGANNVSGVLPDHNAVYLKGTDTATVPGCQLNERRFGSHRLLGFHTAQELIDDPCAGVCTPYGVYSARNDSDVFVADTFPDGSTRRDGNLYPPMLWEKTDTLSGALSPYAEPDTTDMHMVMTYVHDWTLEAADTLTVYSVVTSVHDGTVDDVKANLDAAFEWYRVNLRAGCEELCGCCKNVVGNVDGDPGEVVDIGDLTALIDYLFITKPAPVLPCPEEANIDGDPAGVIDIGDLTALIDYLFITKPAPPLNPC
ncbi:MAG TPA: hypothetical protein VMY05_00720 [Acidobacteriota bacterium]|nr:hypothetical protein [Acidobacteriota bacterium]